MRRERDYIPQNPAQFKEFMRNLIMYVESNTGTGRPWANIPLVRVAQLGEIYIEFDEAFDVALETPTSANIERRRDAQAAVTAVKRAFVNQFLRFPPASPEELEHHLMASRTPFTLHFEETERGMAVQIALCWQNERGIRGAWSEYKSAFIP